MFTPHPNERTCISPACNPGTSNISCMGILSFRSSQSMVGVFAVFFIFALLLKSAYCDFPFLLLILCKIEYNAMKL